MCEFELQILQRMAENPNTHPRRMSIMSSTKQAGLFRTKYHRDIQRDNLNTNENNSRQNKQDKTITENKCSSMDQNLSLEAPS